MTYRARNLCFIQTGLIAMLAVGAAACGDDPSKPGGAAFGAGSGSNSSSAQNADSLASAPDSAAAFEEGDDSYGEGSSSSSSGERPVLNIAGINEKEFDAVEACLSKWKNHPFQGSVANFTKVAASVTVGGMGNAINDTTPTTEPHLYLLVAGVNVLGSPTYNLMNPNGYYCLMVGVNVLANLSVNLHCNAHLADSKVNVNVLSSTSGSIAGVGVDVLSEVKVNDIRPEGAICLR